MPSNKPSRRKRRAARRLGADAAFAKAMARSEFGRFYTDDAEQAEVRRSLARAKATRRVEAREPQQAEHGARGPAADKATKRPLWSAPTVRHRRSEIAASLARLKEARNADKERDGD